MSSSSALVVAVTCAFSRFLKVEMSRSVLADVCSNSERHVGTAGGGMDQAAICLSEQGMARLIHFNPLITGKALLFWFDIWWSLCFVSILLSIICHSSYIDIFINP